jgi:hypothetical protein
MHFISNYQLEAVTILFLYIYILLTFEMIELEKYSNCGDFRFGPDDRLSEVCNAPNKYGGLYLIYAKKTNDMELVYIGISGRLDKLTKKLIARKDGIKGRIVKGKRDGELRKDYWVREMLKGQIDWLQIFWFVVHDENTFQDCPKTLEKRLINKYSPLWNRTK